MATLFWLHKYQSKKSPIEIQLMSKRD